LRIFAILIALSLFLGCISLGDKSGQNASENGSGTMANDTVTIVPPAPSQWKRYNGPTFSFEYPSKMESQNQSGELFSVFSATHVENGLTYEALIVADFDTAAIYGRNKDDEFRTNPSKAASDSLTSDLSEDMAGVLDDAKELGPVSIFSIERSAYGARVPFKVSLENLSSTYSGYAADIYVPERSMLIRFRVLALDGEKAKEIMDNFLLTFRLE
jgi:hypothetical protein